MTEKERNIGLDYFRTFAIIFVLISHSRYLFTYIDGINWWILSVGGYLGVELFFVLSGFLIGKILIEKVLLVDNKLKAFKNFMIRRWFRTLPLYYLLLLVYMVVFSFQQHTLFFSWSHLFFLQNFSPEGLNFFAVSWSLSVEEWFYLCTPILLAISMLVFRKSINTNIFISIIFLLLVIISIKILLVIQYPEWTWTDVRKNIFLRFDSLLVGVLISYIQYFHIKIFNFLGTKKVFNVSMLVLLCLVSWYFYQGDSGLSHDFFSKALMFTVTSISLVLLMIYFFFYIERKSLFFYHGSRLSYGIYLIHFLFLEFFIKQSHFYKEPYLSFIFLLLFLGITIVTSYLLYRFYELPLMNLREKFSTR